MHTVQSQLSTIHLPNKKVFLRADLNVPLTNGSIAQDFRLQQLQPTLDYLIKHHAKILIATHIGRPKNHEPTLSTQVLIPWFKQHGYTIQHAATLKDAQKYMQEQNKNIVLLENLRFFPGEQQKNHQFAQELKNLADIYVNDAFGAIHRSDTSMALLPTLFTAENRTIGFLIEHELQALNSIMHNPRKPFVCMLGGGKITDKIPLIIALLPVIDTLILCPAIVYTVLKSLGDEVGTSLVDNEQLPAICPLLNQAAQYNVEIIIPNDFLTKQGTIVELDDFGTNDCGYSIGPATVGAWESIIQHAGTIFINGLPGMISKPETLIFYNKLLNMVAKSDAYSIIAGGDSVAAALNLGLKNDIDYLSTGGGAVLAYLGNKELPGLKSFE